MSNVIKVNTAGEVVLFDGKPTCVCCGCGDCSAATCFSTVEINCALQNTAHHNGGSTGNGVGCRYALSWLTSSWGDSGNDGTTKSVIVKIDVCFPRTGRYKFENLVRQLGAYSGSGSVPHSVKNAKLYMSVEGSTTASTLVASYTDIDETDGTAGNHTVTETTEVSIDPAGTYRFEYRADLASEPNTRALIALLDEMTYEGEL